jgi:molybdopterin synthase catalytic subunit
MKITVEAFAIARDRFGWSRRELVLDDAATVDDCLRLLANEHPGAANVLASSRFAFNDEYVGREALLKDGGTLSVIPPVSGGAPNVVVDGNPIDLDEALAAVRSDSDGAVVVFLGTVRDTNHGFSVTAIEYEAKVPMAVKELGRLIHEARARFAITSGFIRHRIGRVPVGEASVVIAVAAPHRASAYDANAWLLDELKKVAPIWKNEERVIDGRVERVWLGAGGG